MKQDFSIHLFMLTFWQKRFQSHWLPILFILSALLVVGCGKTSSKAPELPKPLHACDLLTRSEAEAIIGASVDEPQETQKEQKDPEHWMSLCNYYSEEKSISAGVTIMPHGRKVNGKEAFALYEAEMKKGLGNDYTMEYVEGVGDYAGWEQSTKQLTIFQGPFMLIIGVVSPKLDETAALEFNKQLAEKVLPKLPQ